MEEEQKNIEEIQNELEECQNKSKEYLEGWKRERADFLNYKKDEMERISALIRYSGEEIIVKFLPILDNFYLATRRNFLSENSGGQGREMADSFFEGFLQIKTQMEEFLK